MTKPPSLTQLLDEHAAGSYTSRLTYSRLERLHFRVFGRWPQRVVERRLLANDLDAAALRGKMAIAAFQQAKEDERADD